MQPGKCKYGAELSSSSRVLNIWEVLYSETSINIHRLRGMTSQKTVLFIAKLRRAKDPRTLLTVSDSEMLPSGLSLV
jgi:hypothetical protein